MKPTPDYEQISETVFVWHDFNPECKAECFSTAVHTPEGFVLIDPIRLEEQALERMVGASRVAAVLLTNGNHERGTAYEKERLDIPVLAPEGARKDVTADQWVRDGEIVFSAIKAVGLPGGSPGETAYLFGEVLIIGDAIIALDGLQILPEKYCENPRLLRESVRALAALDFRTACFAHGFPILDGAREKIAAVVGGN